MNKIIKTAVVHKLENVKYTCQINYTFLKKKQRWQNWLNGKGKTYLFIINFLALINTTYTSIFQRKTIIIMCQSFDKLLHMYIAPKQWNLYKNSLQLNHYCLDFFCIKTSTILFKKKKKSPLKTILINK